MKAFPSQKLTVSGKVTVAFVGHDRSCLLFAQSIRKSWSSRAMTGGWYSMAAVGDGDP